MALPISYDTWEWRLMLQQRREGLSLDLKALPSGQVTPALDEQRLQLLASIFSILTLHRGASILRTIPFK